MEKISVLYRFDADYRNRPWLQEFKVIKETPCGWWIEIWFNSKNRWVSKTTIKKYAYPTKQEALIGYTKRKEKQLWHLDRTTKNVKEMIEEANKVDLSIKLLTFDGGF
jgi:hypothetical protein